MNNHASTIAIQHIIDDWVDAICKGDMDRVLRHRVPDVVMFDVPEPIQEKGLDAYRETWNLFFDHNPPGPDRFRIGELNIVAGENVGFAHGLLTTGGAQAHCRLTLGFRKDGADWCVLHEHHSMPLELGSCSLKRGATACRLAHRRSPPAPLCIDEPGGSTGEEHIRVSQ